MKNVSHKLLIALLLVSSGSMQASEVIKLKGLDKPALEWVVDGGSPLYFLTESRYNNLLGEQVGPVHLKGAEMKLILSPGADKRLVSLLEPMDQVKDGQRMTDYYVFDQYDRLEHSVTKGSGSDLKAPVAAISDEGVLALVDPISAVIQFYRAGDKIAETPLYEAEGDYSLERNAFVEWVGERCYILIERPGQSAILISIDDEGRNQRTSILPFSSISKYVFRDDRFFLSGYTYYKSTGVWNPIVMETDEHGKAMWTNKNFGHELALSSDATFLAARKSHDAVMLFDLTRGRVEEIKYPQDGKVSLGLNVTNRGKVGLIRVPSDFFVKKTSFHAEVFFPQSNTSVNVELNPRTPGMFKLHSDGHRLMLGTQYEWLEVRE